MTRLHGLMVVLSGLLMSACTSQVGFLDKTGLNGKSVLEYQRKDNTVVTCVIPSSDLFATEKNGGIAPDFSLRKLGIFINLSETVDPKALKTMSADFPDAEVLRYRLCEQYGNTLLTLEQYQQFQQYLQVVQEPVPTQEKNPESSS